LEKSLISKLLVRIANHRETLEIYFDEVADKNGEVTKENWSEGLNQVLGINIPFVRLAEQLGLGDFADQSVERIKYKGFLDNFRPHKPSENDDGGTVKSQLGELLFQKRVELVSLFRSFDSDKSGTISIDEFKKGISSLIKISGHDIEADEIDRLSREIDLIQGLFFYEEYFNNYAPTHLSIMPSKQKNDLRRQKSIVLESAAIGIMQKQGLVEDLSASDTGINTLVAEEQKDKTTEIVVMKELRSNTSLEEEESDNNDTSGTLDESKE